jgi:hypothetical protein
MFRSRPPPITLSLVACKVGWLFGDYGKQLSIGFIGFGGSRQMALHHLFLQENNKHDDSRGVGADPWPNPAEYNAIMAILLSSQWS